MEGRVEGRGEEGRVEGRVGGAPIQKKSAGEGRAREQDTGGMLKGGDRTLGEVAHVSCAQARRWPSDS